MSVTHRPSLILASASPRRHDILTQLRIPHRVVVPPSPDGEDEPRLPGEAPRDYVQRTARDKALHAANWLAGRQGVPLQQVLQETANTGAAPHAPGSITHGQAQKNLAERAELGLYILAADTTVALGNDILGKPTDAEDAARTLARLSGQTHHVYTAVAVYHHGHIAEAMSTSVVRFKPLSDDEISAYCATGEPIGKAGSYGIQGPAAAFVEYMEGSYTGIVGLPAYETATLLTQVGFRV